MKLELILCAQADDELKNYIDVFDEIEVKNKTDRINFTLVCKADFENENVETVSLHFFLFHETTEKKLGLYLSEGIYERENDFTNEGTDDFKVEFNSVPISGFGKYAVEVVRNDNMQDVGSEKGPDVYKTGKIVGRITFSIKEDSKNL